METNCQELEDFLRPLSRLERAAPPPQLWEGIVTQINSPRAKQVSLISWRKVAAAAAIVLALNTAGIIYTVEYSSTAISTTNYDTTNSLVANFQLYE